MLDYHKRSWQCWYLRVGGMISFEKVILDEKLSYFKTAPTFTVLCLRRIDDTCSWVGVFGNSCVGFSEVGRGSLWEFFCLTKFFVPYCRGVLLDRSTPRDNEQNVPKANPRAVRFLKLNRIVFALEIFISPKTRKYKNCPPLGVTMSAWQWTIKFASCTRLRVKTRSAQQNYNLPPLCECEIEKKM